MILKLLLVIGVIAVVYFMFIKKKPAVTQNKTDVKKKQTDEPSSEMIECASCGIYCEIDDTIISNNKYYCSNECVEKG